MHGHKSRKSKEVLDDVQVIAENYIGQFDLQNLLTIQWAEILRDTWEMAKSLTQVSEHPSIPSVF